MCGGCSGSLYIYSKQRNKESDRFAIFSAELLKLLKRTVDIPGPATLSQRRERLWVSFAKIRAERLPTLWKGFLQDIGCASSIEEPLLMELTNESLLESMAKDMYSIPQPEERTPTCTSPKMNKILFAMPVVTLA